MCKNDKVIRHYSEPFILKILAGQFKTIINVKIQVYKPINAILKRYIKNYYTLQQTDQKKKVSYLTFPNPYSIVSIILKVDLNHFPNEMNIVYNSDKTLVSDLTLSYKKPILINYKGIIKELSICFKPLGINSFIENSKENIFEKTPFFPYLDYEQKMTKIIDQTSNEEFIPQLENYLLSKLTNFTHPFLYKFINDISNDPEILLVKLSRKYGISQKTLIKHTKTYLNRTPSEFKKVLRFNKALNEYMNNEKKVLSLTEISNAVYFFDQAHMIRDFKDLTGYTPRMFFKNLNSRKGELNWIFLNR